jgi:hypothetical protein
LPLSLGGLRASGQSLTALILSDTPNPIIEEILIDESYTFDLYDQMPTSITQYNVVIADDFEDIRNNLAQLDHYIRYGGGFVFTGSAAQGADLENNCCLLGAEAIGYTTTEQDATVSVDNPLGTILKKDNILIQQASEGSIWVADLAEQAQILAKYNDGEVFAYSYEFTKGKVFFQSETNVPEAVDTNKELLKGGILWATGSWVGCFNTQDCLNPGIDEGEEEEQSLPIGTEITTGNSPPSENYTISFSDPESLLYDFPTPSGETRSIFVTVGPQLVGATLYFQIPDEDIYIYNVQPDSNALITFPTEKNITFATLAAEELLDTDSGNTATLGYVTVAQQLPEDQEEVTIFRPKNKEPVIEAIANSTASEGITVFLTALASDPDGFVARYSWIQTGGPPVLLSGADTSIASFTAPLVDSNTTLSFVLTVTDNERDSVEKQIFVTVMNILEGTASGLILDAGDDRFVLGGSLVVLNGTIQSLNGPIAGTDNDLPGVRGNYTYKWQQVAGEPVTLSNAESLNASFVAPTVAEGTTKILTFQLNLQDRNNPVVVNSDQVTLYVNNTLTFGGYQDDGVIPTDPLLPVSSPISPRETFGISMALNVQPPEQIYNLRFTGFPPYRLDVPPPSGEIVGLWVNTTSLDASELRLHFDYHDSSFYMELPPNKVIAYVFDRSVILNDIWLGAESLLDGGELQIAYYYNEVPLAPQSLLIPSPPLLQDDAALGQQDFRSPSDPLGVWINFSPDADNPLFIAIVAAAPAGVAIIYIKLSTYKKIREEAIIAATKVSTTVVVDPSEILFPSFDPIAGEAEKARPVIEELERILGTDLDTALNASELLGKFTSGSKNKNQKQS